MTRLANRRTPGAAHQATDPERRAALSPDRVVLSSGSTRSPLMNVAEVAEYLRTTPKGVYCMIARGTLPVTRVGRRVLVRRDVLERALDEKTATSPSRR